MLIGVPKEIKVRESRVGIHLLAVRRVRRQLLRARREREAGLLSFR